MTTQFNCQLKQQEKAYSVAAGTMYITHIRTISLDLCVHDSARPDTSCISCRYSVTETLRTH